MEHQGGVTPATQDQWNIRSHDERALRQGVESGLMEVRRRASRHALVGGATFGHRLKAHAQFECNDKVSSRLGKPSSQRASSFGRRPMRLRRKPIRHRRRRREAKSDEDRGAYGEDRFATGEYEEKRREAKTRAPTAKSKTRREGVGE